VLLPVQAVGFVPYRPIGKSHFVHAPWNVSDAENPYIPSDMSEEALRKCLAKYPQLVKPYTDEELGDAYHWLREQMLPIWSSCKVWTQQEAIDDCDLSKGSGHPYHYEAPTKEQALDMFASEIERDTERVLAGDETVDMPSCLTLKDELRTEERVKAHKTRGFNASNFVHLLASKRLFGDQNNRLHEARGSHPITLGISVPGDEFVSAILRLGNEANDADGDGYDLNVNLGLMRVIRDVRKSFLPEEFAAAVDLLYDTIYAGDTIAAGVIYRLICQKSGWANTGDDNSLHLWLALYITHKRLGGSITSWSNLINGDDWATGKMEPCGYKFVDVVADLAKNGIKMSYENPESRSAMEITFLSHSIRERFVRGFGDVLVAAGNRAKLRSSLNWVHVNDTLTFEESCLAHLLGIRLCLWPWRADFLEVDELVQEFLDKMPHKSQTTRQILKARLTEEHIALIHFSMEGGFCFSPLSILDEVDQVTYGLIKKILEIVC
jgi:hypothetical protein